MLGLRLPDFPCDSDGAPPGTTTCPDLTLNMAAVEIKDRGVGH